MKPALPRVDAALSLNGVDERFRAQVDATLLGMAYDRLRLSVLLTLGVCVVFIGLLMPFFALAASVVWSSCLVVTASARLLLWWAHRKASSQGRGGNQPWRGLYFAGAVAAGASWAVGPVLMMPEAGRTESMLLLLTLLSVSAVAMISLAAQPRAMHGFLLTALLPTIAALFATGGDVERMAAAVVFAGMVSLAIVGRESSASIRALLEIDLRLSHAIEDTSAARARAEAASLAKSRFLANLSHELRTPLNVVIGAAQLIKAGEHDAEQRAQLVDAVQCSGTDLLGLIENILDLSRIEAGELELMPQDFHLVNCVEAALATAGLAARAKGLQLACIVAPELPAWRHGDAARLRQVLLNLLGNAVKFTVEGEIVVRVEPGPGAEDVRFSVTDTGIGIGEASLAQVFEPFRQADDGAQRRFGGSGLGLAIVRQLVEAMGGRIGLRSRLNQGSCFEFVLPLRAAREAGAEAPAQRPKPLALMTAEQLQAVTHVLVVEDDALNQTIVSRLLRHAGYRVSAVGSGPAALVALREGGYDLVLMDWQMPDMDGLEATRRIRAGEAGAAAAELPIVALTANAFAEDRDACLRAGMNDFLTKPVLAASLTAAVQRWARRRPAAAAPAAASTSPPSAQADAAAPAFDPTVLAALPMVADGTQPEYAQELLSLFIESVPPSLASIRQAALLGDTKTVQRQVHSLKSSSATIGALSLVAAAAAAETALRAGAGLAPGLADQLLGEFERLKASLAPAGGPIITAKASHAEA